jgi:two-component system, OmpR family, sensor histidine kinase BaeS
MPMSRRSNPIAVRLALSFVAVAIAAVAIVAGLAVVLGGHDINVMVQQRRNDLTASLLVDAASTYSTGQPGWSDADLRPALDLAAQSGTDVAVLDTDGRIVASTFANPNQASNVHRSAINVDGQRTGTLIVKFNHRGLVASADNLRNSLTSAVIGAAGLAAVLALVIGLLVARRLSRPVDGMISTVRAMSAGDRHARVGRVENTASELQELALAFDGMADTLVGEEQLRRGVVADVAHELRTPVAILQANCEALMDGVVQHTPQQTRSLHEEVLRLAAMVDDLQNLASAEAAALHLQLGPCDFGGIVDGAVDAMRTQLTAAGLSIQQQLEPTPIDGDPVRLHQATTNILANAMKFTPPGGRLVVNVSALDGHARLEVSDTGVGIAAADQPHVFDRFWRGPNATDVPGSGIGLAVVAELVRAHHGTVEIDSEPGRGTRVIVSIPLAAPGTA